MTHLFRLGILLARARHELHEMADLTVLNHEDFEPMVAGMQELLVKKAVPQSGTRYCIDRFRSELETQIKLPSSSTSFLERTAAVSNIFRQIQDIGKVYIQVANPAEDLETGTRQTSSPRKIEAAPGFMSKDESESLLFKRIGDHTLNAALEFGQKLDQSCWPDFDTDDILLPSITMNFIQARITITGDNKVYMIQRVAYKQFKGMLAQYLAVFRGLFDKDSDGSVGSICGDGMGGVGGSAGGGGGGSSGPLVFNKKALYLTGPRGVGKSYMLYLLSCQLRAKRDTCRVTYINDCEAWRRLGYEYLLTELISTFHDAGLGIVTEALRILNSDRAYERLSNLIADILEFVRKRQLHWFLIADQHNALHRDPPVQELAPFCILKELVGREHVTVLISASANNEAVNKEMIGFHRHDVGIRNFDESDFKAWCRYSGFELDAMKDVSFWTGNIPLELTIFADCEGSDPQEKLKSYLINRVFEIARLHRTFMLGLKDDDLALANLSRCVSHMALGLASPLVDIGVDRQIFHIAQDGAIVVLNPVCRRAIIPLYKDDAFASAAQVIFKDQQITNDVKGKVAERYIISSFQRSASFSFAYREMQCRSRNSLESTRQSTNGFFQNVNYFDGLSVPAGKFDNSTSALFIPLYSNYPLLDFFIWDALKHVLMAFQVTVCNPLSCHMKLADQTRWISMLGNWSSFIGDVDMTISVFWIAPDDCIDKNLVEIKVEHNCVVSFSDLYLSCPALQDLYLIPSAQKRVADSKGAQRRDGYSLVQLMSQEV